MGKYKESLKLLTKLTKRVPLKRPDCEKVCKDKHLWSLDWNDFDFETESKPILASRKKNFYVYNILESKIR
jgi:hypothetical protein